MKSKIKKYIKNNYSLLILLIIAIALSIASILYLGYDYTINSDDLSYINSGIRFFEEGKITMHGVVSAQIMPGLTFLIAGFCLIFGTGTALIIALKVFWLIMGLISIVILYKIIRIYANQWIATFCCLFLLAPDFLWMNNLILTETPFLLVLLLLIYHSLRFFQDNKNRDFYFIILWYIIGIYIRPTIGLFPIFLALALLIKKYKFKELIKKGLIGGIVLVLCLSPWIYRNYKVFGKFIPLTYGMGNPLLLGTYQGYGYPSDEELDYITNVDEKMPDEMKHYLNEDYPRDEFKVYYLLEYDGLKAKYRMQEWWEKDKISMLKSYLIEKPKIMLHSSFYWDELFNININFNLLLRKIELILFAISCLTIIISREKVIEWILLMAIYGYQVLLYCYSFAYSRYAITLFPIRFIIMGIGLSVIVEKIKNRRNKHYESSNYHTGLQRRIKHIKNN